MESRPFQFRPIRAHILFLVAILGIQWNEKHKP